MSDAETLAARGNEWTAASGRARLEMFQPPQGKTMRFPPLCIVSLRGCEKRWRPTASWPHRGNSYVLTVSEKRFCVFMPFTSLPIRPPPPAGGAHWRRSNPPRMRNSTSRGPLGSLHLRHDSLDDDLSVIGMNAIAPTDDNASW
jgi:hypothetical protein